MDDFLTFILFFLLGYFVARALAALIEINKAIQILKTERDSIRQSLEKGLRNNVIMMRLETNEDGVFAYRMESSEFLAHGVTYDQMIENLLARFPGKTALVYKDQVDLARGEQS